MQILLQRIVVQTLKGRCIIKLFAHRVSDRSVLAQDVELQLIGPPVAVPGAAAAHVGFLDGGMDRTFRHGFVSVCQCVSEVVVVRRRRIE